MPLNKVGTFHVFSTRNTDFTNRSQKAELVVTENPHFIWAAVGGGLAAAFFLGCCYSQRRKWPVRALNAERSPNTPEH